MTGGKNKNAHRIIERAEIRMPTQYYTNSSTLKVVEKAPVALPIQGNLFSFTLLPSSGHRGKDTLIKAARHTHTRKHPGHSPILSAGSH